nr:AAA family ATPase [uncultured Acetatifactor sp.]
MIHSFSCKNFRNVSCEDLEFERINILIGANNAGKSNFIRALSFAANMVSSPKTETTGFLSEMKRNGWNTAIDRHGQSSPFRFVWNLELLRGRSVAYTLCANAGKKREENYIVEEALDSSEARESALAPYAIQTRHIAQIAKEQNGMTGEKLIDFAADFIGKRRFEEEGYEAILIEDDKDGRFLSVQENGTAIIDENEWYSFKNRVMERLNKIRPGIPIVFFYAAPEIEAWFLADWKNGFGNAYKGVYTVPQNEYLAEKCARAD